MTLSKRLSDKQHHQYFIVKNAVFSEAKSYVSLTACVSDDYKNTLKIREIESNIGVGSEKRIENGGKMSVYSTKKIGDG